jgi:tetratricopeptide (TPR) repeat protein
MPAYLPILALTFAAFFPALSAGLVNWDDAQRYAPDYLGHYQPLTSLSYALDILIWGDNPFGQHLTNVLLHCLNACLLFKLARELDPKSGVAGAALAALLFSLHPLRVESVAWLTERRDVLSGACLLAATLAYHAHIRGRRWAYVLSVAAFAAAMLSKVTSAAWPFALLALDWHLKRRNFREKLPYLAVAFLVLPLAFKAQLHSGAMPGLDKAPLSMRFSQSLFSVAFYPWKTLWPAGFSPLYEQGYLEARRWLIAAGGLLLLITPAALLKLPRPAAAAWGFYLLALFPMCGLVKSGIQVAADRYSYVPMMGLALLAGCWLGRRGWAVRAGAVVLPVLWFLTWQQTRLWKDSASLWEQAVRVGPPTFFNRMNAAMGLHDRGEHEEALRRVTALLAERPGPPDPKILSVSHYQLGLDLYNRYRAQEAVVHLRIACRLAPDVPGHWLTLGLAEVSAGNPERGRAAFKKASALDPSDRHAAELARARIERRKP